MSRARSRVVCRSRTSASPSAAWRRAPSGSTRQAPRGRELRGLRPRPARNARPRRTRAAQRLAHRGVGQQQRPRGGDLEELRDDIPIGQGVRERGPIAMDRAGISGTDGRIAPVVVAAVIAGMRLALDPMPAGLGQLAQHPPQGIGEADGPAQEDRILGLVVEGQQEIRRGGMRRPDDLLEGGDLGIEPLEPIGVRADDRVADQVGQELAPAHRLVSPVQIIGEDDLLAVEGVDPPRVAVDEAVPLPEEDDVGRLVELPPDQVPHRPGLIPELGELHGPPAMSRDQLPDGERELPAHVMVETREVGDDQLHHGIQASDLVMSRKNAGRCRENR